MKKMKKVFKKLLKPFLVFILIISWTLTSFPRIPFVDFPPKIKETKAATLTIVLNYTQTILTEGTTWTVPADWTSANNTIEVIGGGGVGFTDTTGIAGAAGGGGGAYSKSVNQTLTPGATVTYQIGIGGKNNAATGGVPNGGDTYFCSGTANCASIAGTAVIAGAKGGVGATNQTGAAGGLATGGFAYGTGNIKNNGGTGGAGGNATSQTGGGGGGAGGPQAAGKTGGAGYTAASAGGSGGGGGNGGTSSTVGAAGTSTTGGAGGSGDLGSGGGAAGNGANAGNGTTSGAGGGGGDAGFNAGNGFNGANLGGGVGPGGGGGGAGDTTTAVGMGGDGGLYGAGGGGGRYGGRGAPGVIIITYNGNTPTRTTWTVPSDWDSANNTIEVIGGGGSTFSTIQGSGEGGGGGGAYSKSVNQTLTPGGTVTYQIGQGGRKTAVGTGVAGINGGDTYFCNATGANCTAITGSAVVAGAKGGLGSTSITGAAGGAAASGFAYGTGNAKWSGGAGGSGHNTGDSGGGGGGAAGSSQNGLNGGIGYTSASGGGGGGGGAGDDSGTNSTVGGAGVSTNGGAGGQGPLGTGSGTGGANTFGGDATVGLGGGGGGGDTPFAGGEGGSGSATTYGGGGGGGTGDSNSVATGALFGGDGGLFGAGGGGALMPGFGANGVIIITYTQIVSTTSISNFVSGEPSNSTIAPAASGLVDSFGLQTNISTDTVTGATVTLAAGTGARVATVAITNDGDTVTYCSAAPSGDAATLSTCGIPVTTTNTQFKIKITAISHASMPPPSGAEYAVTATVTAFTSGNAQSGSDSGSATVTIDNLSPNGATSTSGSAGNAQVTLNWTTSSSSDFSRSVVLRWTGGTPGSEVPAEGTDYAVDNTITTATVACVRTADAASTPVSGTDGAGTGGCSAVALTNGQAYSYKVFQKDSNGNYDVGVTFTGSPFTPAAAASTFTQNRYAWYFENTDLVNPTDLWPSGSINLGENAAITITPVANDPPNTTQKLRLRVNFSVATANMAVSTKYFKLQFRTGTDSDCSAGSWTDVDGGSAWEYATSGITDGADITASLSDTTSLKGQEYVKSRINSTSLNHVAVDMTQITEYDFHIVGTTATTAERYLFRVVETNSGGTGTTAFSSYSGACPILYTEPGTGNLLRHGNVFSGGSETGFFWAD